MNEIKVLPSQSYGYDFIPSGDIPPGKDEYWLRNELVPKPLASYRKLYSHEIEVLVKNENYSTNWDDFLVQDPFDPGLISNSRFHGLVRLGALSDVFLRHHDYTILAGIRNSTIISCDIGDNCAIQNCPFLSHYIIGNTVILSRIDEMQTTNHAKFGNGVLFSGEDEDVRIWIDLMNEAGGRSVLPFQDMIPADAYLWAAYRDDKALTEKLREITQKQYGRERGGYGTVGSGTVVKNTGVVKDVTIGSCAYIKGANKLKNLTILSSEEESTQIGEGVELVNGIIGYGCHIFYGSKAVRFVMGRNCNLKYGARLIHSVIGDNSTVSCCELLNTLIFPVHEQHHNNSFLIASLVAGLSNVAAGATIGSNHNSRANDGELRAGRGFWPGLSVTLKHPSVFASFVIISKGDYPRELNIPLPFSLVNRNAREDRLEVMPAYFWLYNMYALERNVWKFTRRDKRRHKVQHIEMDYLAPDTAEEIVSGIKLLEGLLSGADANVADAESVFACEMERSKNGTAIIKPKKGLAAYKTMLRYYVLKTIAAYLLEHKDQSFKDMVNNINANDAEWEEAARACGRVREWVNIGGQIAPAFRIDRLRERIGLGKLDNWDAIHAEYNKWAALYEIDRLRHAWSVLPFITKEREKPLSGLSTESFKEELSWLLETKRLIAGEVFSSRDKDFKEPFRRITYRNQEEMEMVIGKTEDNPFIVYLRNELAAFEAAVEKLKERL